MENMVVLIPGIMGSVLQHDGQDIWNLSLQAVCKATKKLIFDRSLLEQLYIEKDDDLDRHYLDDGIRATGLIQDARLFPGFFKIYDGYSYLRQQLTQNFDLNLGENYFEFAYDWRRDK